MKKAGGRVGGEGIAPPPPWRSDAIERNKNVANRWNVLKKCKKKLENPLVGQTKRYKGRGWDRWIWYDLMKNCRKHSVGKPRDLKMKEAGGGVGGEGAPPPPRKPTKILGNLSSECNQNTKSQKPAKAKSQDKPKATKGKENEKKKKKCFKKKTPFF